MFLRFIIYSYKILIVNIENTKFHYTIIIVIVDYFQQYSCDNMVEFSKQIMVVCGWNFRYNLAWSTKPV
jgi:hypothetical protein